MDIRYARGCDGTLIRYQAAGSGRFLVIANGLGLEHNGLALQVEHFRRSCRVLCWDYRGTHGSTPLKAGASLAMHAHARDLDCVLEAEKAEKVLFVGWSMGVPVLLEFARLFPGRIIAAAAISGPYGNMFSMAFHLPCMNSVLPQALRMARDSGRLIEPLMRLASGLPGFAKLMKLSGWVSRDCDEAVLAAMTKAVASCDMRIYFETLLEIGRFDATDFLPSIDFPLLIFAGEKDLFTPPKVAERMHAVVKGSRLVMIPGATHYGLIEKPDIVNGAIFDFFKSAGS